MAFEPRQDKARAARPVCFVPAIGYEGRVNAPSLHIEDAAPDRRGRSLLDADPGPSVLVVLLLLGVLSAAAQDAITSAPSLVSQAWLPGLSIADSFVELY